MREKVSLIIEFNDVLTRRLLRRRPDLLAPARIAHSASAHGDAGIGAENVDQMNFHRTYLETGALAMAVHSLAGWQCFGAILDSSNGYAPYQPIGPHAPRARVCFGAVPSLVCVCVVWSSVHLCAVHVTEVLSRDELARHSWSFTALSHRVTNAGHGILLGWRRRTDTNSPSSPGASRVSIFSQAKKQPASGVVGSGRRVTLNPRHKATALRWCAEDLLVVLKRDQRAWRPRHLTIGGGARTTKNLISPKPRPGTSVPSERWSLLARRTLGLSGHNEQS